MSRRIVTDDRHVLALDQESQPAVARRERDSERKQNIGKRALPYVACAFFLLHCSGPPESISFGPAFSNEERAVGAEAIRAWCDAVNWCPTIVPNQGEAHVLRMSSPQIQEKDGAVDGINSGLYVQIWADEIPPEDLFSSFAHEFGHFNIEGHPSRIGKMMSQFYVAHSALHTIDQEAIDAWNSHFVE